VTADASLFERAEYAGREVGGYVYQGEMVEKLDCTYRTPRKVGFICQRSHNITRSYSLFPAHIQIKPGHSRFLVKLLLPLPFSVRRSPLVYWLGFFRFGQQVFGVGGWLTQQ
jgi:hypothetical protein